MEKERYTEDFYDRVARCIEDCGMYYATSEDQIAVFEKLQTYVWMCWQQDKTNFQGALKYVAETLRMNYSCVRRHYSKMVKRTGKDPLAYKAREYELVDEDFL